MDIITCALLHLKRISKYKSVLIGCFLLPAIAICIFAVLTGGITDDGSTMDISMSVVNNDKGSLGDSMISELKKSSNISYNKCSFENAKSSVKNNKSDAAIVIPEDFSQKVKNAEAPDIKIYKLSGTNTDIAVTNGIYSFITKEMISSDILKSSQNEGLTNEIKKQLENKTITVDVSTTNAGKETSIFTTISINLVISFFMYSMIYIVNEIISLKKSRTLRRCFSTPHSSINIAASLIIAFLCIGWIQAALMMGIPHILFKTSLGSSFTALFLIVTVLFIVILSMGMLICSFIKSEDLAPVAVNIIVTITCMAGGTFMPLQFMPDFIKKISVFTPQNWALTAMQDVIIKNKGVLYILPKLGILLLFAAAFLTAASASIKKFVEE